jgi:hypothetical protein
LPAGFFNQLLAGSFRESSSFGDDFMHPENTTEISPAQAGAGQGLLVTESSDFGAVGSVSLFTTARGVSCGVALNVASASLSSAQHLLGDLIDINESCHLAYAVRTLVQQAKSLIDSTVLAVERVEGKA